MTISEGSSMSLARCFEGYFSVLNILINGTSIEMQRQFVLNINVNIERLDAIWILRKKKELKSLIATPL